MMTRKILVADTDIQLLQALRVCLRSEGFDVTLVQSLDDAVTKAESNPPDLVLVDVSMRSADGRGVQQCLSACPSLSSAPAIYFTGAENVEATAAHGAAAILHKPFDGPTLVASIREALGDAVRSPSRMA